MSSKPIQRESTRCDALHSKKGDMDLKTIRHVNIQLVPGAETSPIKLVDAVSPIDETGHPQLICALRRRVMTRREGCGNFDRYVQAALLRLMCIALAGHNNA